MPLAWIEISKSALLHNVRYFREKSGGKKIIVMIKSNAYGHGLFEVATIIRDHVDAFTVADVAEGIKLREIVKDKPIFVILPAMEEEEIREAISHNLSLFVGNIEYLRFLSSFPEEGKIKIHLEINTGMNRTGIEIHEIPQALEILEKNKHIELEGVFSHFATLPQDVNFATKQFNLFIRSLEYFENFNILWIHMENSAGVVLTPLEVTNSVRPGISIYGLPPSESLALPVKPVLSLKSKIIDIRTIEKGEGVSYDLVFRASKRTRVATIGFGYGSGYMRNLGDKADVIVKGRRAPIIGRICMNHILIDITSIPDVKLYDTVTLIGKDGDEEITATELAVKSGTINYEITTKLFPHIKRVIVK